MSIYYGIYIWNIYYGIILSLFYISGPKRLNHLPMVTKVMRSRVRAWTEWSPDFCVCSCCFSSTDCTGPVMVLRVTVKPSPAQNQSPCLLSISMATESEKVTSLLQNSFCCFPWLHSCQPPVNSLPSPGPSTKSLKLIVLIFCSESSGWSLELLCVL